MSYTIKLESPTLSPLTPHMDNYKMEKKDIFGINGSLDLNVDLQEEEVKDIVYDDIVNNNSDANSIAASRYRR